MLLHEAVKNPGVQMVEKLFVFTDMQFDQAHCMSAAGDTGWETTYQTIEKMYASKGFVVPKIIFWNLRATHKSFAVEKNQVGTALISGFSSAILKALLEGDVDKFDPTTVMDEVLKVYDMVKVSEVERVPFSQEEMAGFATDYDKVNEIVEEFLVPKTKKNGKRKKTGR